MGVTEQNPKQRRGGAWWCCGACGLVALASGIFLLLVGIWFTHLYQRFTPIYRPITCQLEPPKVDKFWFDHGLVGLHLKLTAVTTCQNPNPYSVVINSSQASQIFMGKDRTPAGAVTEIPAATLPAGGSGSIAAVLTITPTADLIGSLIGGFFGGGEIPVYLENNLDLQIDINLLLGNFSTSRSFSKACGMNLKLRGFAQPAVGQMACADDWDGLTIPAVGNAKRDLDTLVFSASDMASEEVEAGNKVKNLAMTIGMVLGYGLGGVFFLMGAYIFYLLCCKARSARVVTMKVAAKDGAMTAGASEASDSDSASEHEVEAPQAHNPKGGNSRVVEEV